MNISKDDLTKHGNNALRNYTDGLVLIDNNNTIISCNNEAPYVLG